MSRAPIRVLVGISSLEIGGAERQVVEICRLLQGNGFGFDVVTFRRGGPLEGALAATGARVHSLWPRWYRGPRTKLERGFWALNSVRLFRRLIARLRPDLIHSYLTETSALLAAARWPRRAPPLIFSKRSLVEWIARRSIYFPIARWTNRQADLILANSDAVRRDAVRKEGAPIERIRVIYNGVDTDLFRPLERCSGLASELNVPPATLVIGMVANLHRYKGHLEVLEALARLPETNRTVLLCVGREGNASSEIRERISRLGLRDRVFFAGQRDDVPQVLSVIDVFVSASHEEGFSNSILEAMAAGKAIVASAVGGTAEQIEEGVSGLLFGSRDVGALTEKLGGLLRDRQLRERLGQAARHAAIERFSLQRLSSEVSAVYTNLAAPARRTSRS